MPVDLLCERCGRKIGSFPWDKVRDYVQANGETCKGCIKQEEKLTKFYTDMRDAYIRRLDKIRDDVLKQLTAKMEEIKNEPD